MNIRKLIPEDAEDYWKLRLKALTTNPDAFLVTYDEAIKKEDPIGEYKKSFLSEDIITIGAFEEAQIVGMVTLVRETRQKIRHRANIVAMFVDDEKRGKGIAKALLTEAIKVAENISEIEQLYLTVDAENKPAKELYKKLGFETFAVDKKAMKYNGQYRGEEHMVLFLEK
ncbi:GNAT family N-acetyltransferase [Fredinandcohnia sp. QZ13]|uniref:GNAT family N-acetyltransferase n=1 Tax=Fredinandcohnia sp. QZ13 TaxID=3073144 RepID=UPI0028530D6E|nr:GNAT family N-acetyltransferase [Fredinandcohnia sp. QZ13]MDR4887111.1 GNAT family N-acetyltransferase [Fredinandcohnia sp. QZ13]